MRVQDLPRLGVIENPMDGELFAQWSNLAGKNLLCLGMSEVQIGHFVLPSEPAGITMLTYWADHVDARSSQYPLVLGDITKRTDFDSEQFDAVLTMSVLEHVSDVGAALDEMARVTRAGGEMLHIFGPVWSSAYGHHLCTADEHPEMNFYRWQMPAHMHLLCSEEEVAEYYDSIGLGKEMGQSVFAQFHQNDHINRQFYDDYIWLLQGFQVARWETMFNRLPREHLTNLRRRFPGRRDFSTYGGCCKLLV